MRLLIYTPTIGDQMRAETKASIEAQITSIDCVWEVGYHNPFPGEKMRNVVAQYQRAQKMTLAGGYDALLTVEHDMILPADAIEKLWNTDAPVIYGVYMLRHGTPTLNAWQKTSNHNIGMSLSLYPHEVEKAKKQGWIEVSGTGWGCTLIRREVLQRLTIHANSETDAGDMAFSTDCLRAGIKQIARFDVPCGHITPDGRILEVSDMDGVVSRVYALVDVTANVNGASMPMKKGRYYSVPVDVGNELARAGYVRITNDTEQPDTAQRETATDPKAATRSKRKNAR